RTPRTRLARPNIRRPFSRGGNYNVSDRKMMARDEEEEEEEEIQEGEHCAAWRPPRAAEAPAALRTAAAAPASQRGRRAANCRLEARRRAARPLAGVARRARAAWAAPRDAERGKGGGIEEQRGRERGQRRRAWPGGAPVKHARAQRKQGMGR
ncbi:unnamed protein product, partial [Prorocentrum cordatum]